MECEDCNKKEADTLVYSKDKDNFFLVCRDCITADDKICSDMIIDKIKKDW